MRERQGEVEAERDGEHDAIDGDQASMFLLLRGPQNVMTKHSVITPSIVKSANREIHGPGPAARQC